ncbi:MAG TPA: serine hydrolase [Candidatus Paceibacterota bacterium]|nr:serine hydrolase [Candidatus Paceibacterota bacterium]
MKFSPRFWAVIILALGAGFGMGWMAHLAASGSNSPALPLRLSSADYKYISPLLACNASKLVPQDTVVSNAIQSVVANHEAQNDITSASVYFADFSTGKWTAVNPGDKYYPSSLGKVPILMAYYGLSEESSSLMDKVVLFPKGSPDLNAEQEIQPEQAIVPGQAYTVRQLLEYMIKYSDNNAAQLLYTAANQSDIATIYSDLEIPVNGNITSSTLDFMTPQQYAILFRTLYNATYLSRDDSEAALSLMTQTSFTHGIVAGVPASTTVAHKFGIVSFYNGTTVTKRELHDCGIVYAPNHSYLLCVMTRGSSDLGSQEQTISDISQTVYETVQKSE